MDVRDPFKYNTLPLRVLEENSSKDTKIILPVKKIQLHDWIDCSLR